MDLIDTMMGWIWSAITWILSTILNCAIALIGWIFRAIISAFKSACTSRTDEPNSSAQ